MLHVWRKILEPAIEVAAHLRYVRMRFAILLPRSCDSSCDGANARERACNESRCRAFGYSVGAPGFEPGTSCSRSWQRSRTTASRR